MRLTKFLSPALALALLSQGTPAVAVQAPVQHDFVLTAYYSPLPDQCCYVKGSYEADRLLNGDGTHGASGQPVYPGMIAAPASYPFGTRISLPSLGMIGTVHDRGGAIVEKEGYDRLDVWMGSGEEGLARALAFGVQHVKGLVYLPGSRQPEEKMDLRAFSAPVQKLSAFAVPQDRALLSLHPERGEQSASVALLQKRLAALGYFNHPQTGLFGEVTEQALKAFQSDYGLMEASNILTERTGAFIEAATERQTSRDALITEVDRKSSQQSVLNAKRTLRFLGYYRGRTTGVYDETLANAILAFQKDHQLVGGAGLPGAGRIGPMTKRTVLKLWERKIVASQAEELLLLARVERKLADSGRRPASFAGLGERGDHVKVVQKFLAARGYLAQQAVTGWFGAQTLRAVLSYQLARNIIPSVHDPAAGFVGPATLATMQREQQRDAYRIVRARGWDALSL